MGKVEGESRTNYQISYMINAPTFVNSCFTYVRFSDHMHSSHSALSSMYKNNNEAQNLVHHFSNLNIILYNITFI